MKKVRLYQVKLIDKTGYTGEIVYRNQKKIILRLPNGQKIHLFYVGIASIKDLGWHKIKG